jgi:hypothetical protein
MENFLLPIFVVNFVLVLCDASLGFFIVPHLLRREARDGDEAGRAGRSAPTLLAVAVAVYMFFNCLAYNRQSMIYLLVVTGLILADLTGQFVVYRKIRNTGER